MAHYNILDRNISCYLLHEYLYLFYYHNLDIQILCLLLSNYHFYWKKKHLLWTAGYFVSTIGKVSEKIVFEYIGKQGK